MFTLEDFLWDEAVVLETFSCISMTRKGEWRFFFSFSILDSMVLHCLISWESWDGVCCKKTYRVAKRLGLKEDSMDWMFDYHNVKV